MLRLGLPWLQEELCGFQPKEPILYVPRPSKVNHSLWFQLRLMLTACLVFDKLYNFVCFSSSSCKLCVMKIFQLWKTVWELQMKSHTIKAESFWRDASPFFQKGRLLRHSWGLGRCRDAMTYTFCCHILTLYQRSLLQILLVMYGLQFNSLVHLITCYAWFIETKSLFQGR